MSLRRLSIAAVAITVLVAFGTGLGTASGKKKKKGTSSTARAIRKAGWQGNVSITFSGSSFNYRSNGIPSVGYASEYAVPTGQAGVQNPSASNFQAQPASQIIKQQNINLNFTTKPQKTSGTTPTTGGMIGVTIDGAVLFNGAEANGQSALANNFSVKDSAGNDAPFVDNCNGHPGPGGQYHYHGLPPCMTPLVDKANGPSHILGVALDGFPIYGDRNLKGKQISESQLDECNGVKSKTPEFPNGIYHYVLLTSKSNRSSIGCYHGQVTTTLPRALSSVQLYCSLPSGNKP